MLIVLPLRANVAERITGAALAICALIAGAGLGVMSIPPAVRRSDTVSVPETLPVWIASGASDVVAPAGIVKFAVVPPDANCTVRSAGPVSGAKERIACPAIAAGNAASVFT